MFDESLKKRFSKTYKFSNHDINKFFFLLQKGVYPYEYMDDWKKFNEASLPEKEEFFNDRNMENITDADYTHAKKVCIDFETNILDGYQDFYVQSDTLLQAVVFSNFRNMCLEIHEFDPANFLYALRLAWQAAL